MAMKSLVIMLTLLVVMSRAISHSETPTVEEPNVNIKNDNADHELESKELLSFLPRTTGRFLAQKVPACNVYPRVCRAKDSPGPNCCNKQCVNLMIDKQNCGTCGKKCNYSEMCCQGECVNPSSDERHCGRCNKKCNKGSSCDYGLCSYAN